MQEPEIITPSIPRIVEETTSAWGVVLIIEFQGRRYPFPDNDRELVEWVADRLESGKDDPSLYTAIE